MAIFFATPYTIHFDDTMAYGSHHFLTGFKFQCQARESLLYGDLIFDQPHVPEALKQVHLFTADAYNRNLHPAHLGDRLAILLTLEEWGAASARFCYRVINQQGQPIAAGFQNHVCADPQTGQPHALPDPLKKAFDSIRQITEQLAKPSFRELVLAGGEKTRSLFSTEVVTVAQRFLSNRHPVPGLIQREGTTPVEVIKTDPCTTSIVAVEPKQQQVDLKEGRTAFDDVYGTKPAPSSNAPNAISKLASNIENKSAEVWFFPGQGTFEADYLCRLLTHVRNASQSWHTKLETCQKVLSPLTRGDIKALLSGDPTTCSKAVRDVPELNQLGIFLQGVLAAERRLAEHEPGILVGHSLGELAALTVAGSLDFSSAMIAVAKRTAQIQKWGPLDGGLLAVFCSRTEISEELDLGDNREIVIAGRNHDKQTLLSGPKSALRQLMQRLERSGIKSVEIPSLTSFHNPCLFRASEAWRRDLEQLEFKSPAYTVYSVIGRRSVTTPSDMPSSLSVQLLRPFDLQGVIDDLALVGFQNLVDCGSSGILQRLLQAACPASMRVFGVTNLPPTVSNNFSPKPTATLRAPRSNEDAPDRRPLVGITGQGCLLPGGARSPERLREMQIAQCSGIVDLRTVDGQWELDFYSRDLRPDRATSSLAGVVLGSDLSAPANVDVHWFASLSRAQKIFALALHQCLPALEGAGNILCLVGSSADGFEDQDQIAALRYSGIDPAAPNVLSSLLQTPNALLSSFDALTEVLQQLLPTSFRLRLLDAACASSLYAVAQGMSVLENYQADVVLAGGVYCPGPGNNCLFSQFKGLTDTVCRPFDSQASGVVFAEGAAMVVMRRLRDAVKRGETPLAILRGVGLSSDGRSPSANVPKSEGQILALQRCYDNYQIDPGTINAIEGHGTATPTGDAIEVRTLAKFFAPHVKSPIPLHSMKGLVGHTGWAAGTAAIISAIQAIKSKSFPAQANLTQPSVAVQQASHVLYLAGQTISLTKSTQRIAVDGFGFGGANAHVVVEEFVDQPSGVTPIDEDDASSDIHQSTSSSASDKLEIVVVAQYSIDAHSLMAGVSLPAGTVMLPDVAEDMDDSQKIAVQLGFGLLQQLSDFGDSDRQETSVVLAFEGKTLRAAEATVRILGQRLIRDLPSESAHQVKAAYDLARPSGPYTLQCMMPNVAAGRAALLLNLNGPNFVIDAGKDSLNAAKEAAQWLLQAGDQAGTKVVIVGQIPNCPHATPQLPPTNLPVAFAVTTRRHAVEKKWPVLSELWGQSPAVASPATEVTLTHSTPNQSVSWVETPRPRLEVGKIRKPVFLIESETLSNLLPAEVALVQDTALLVAFGGESPNPPTSNKLQVLEFNSQQPNSLHKIVNQVASLGSMDLVVVDPSVKPFSLARDFYQQVQFFIAALVAESSASKISVTCLVGNETAADLHSERLKPLHALHAQIPDRFRLLLSDNDNIGAILQQGSSECRLQQEPLVNYVGPIRRVGRLMETCDANPWNLPLRPLPSHPKAGRSFEFPVELDFWEILQHHQARNLPTLPGAWIVDQMVRCMMSVSSEPIRFVEIQDIRFLRFAKYIPDVDSDYRILLTEVEDQYLAWLLGNLFNNHGQLLKRDEVFASSRLRKSTKPLGNGFVIGQQSRWSKVRTVTDPYCNQIEQIQLSGPFDCLRQIEIDGNLRRASLQPKLNRYWYDTVPALALDAAIRVAGMHFSKNGLHIPTKIDQLVLPVGRSSCSLEDAGWQILAEQPKLSGRDIHCGAVEIFDDSGFMQVQIKGAVVSQIN